MCWSILRLIIFFSFLLILTLNESVYVFADDRNKVWSQLTTPRNLSSAVIGSYSAGCMAGAEKLDLTGRGFQVMRPSRNRYYGHPRLISFIETLGDFAASLNIRLLIGDLSQPWGGPMAYGHVSHQNGLDVDIWFQHIGIKDRLTLTETEKRPLVSIVNITAGNLRTERWSPLYQSALKAAAKAPEVERIFVNPVIKQELCRDPNNHSWLAKVRPWWGHADHFHVRLSCPLQDPQCKPQKLPPHGSGCDRWLDQWVEDQKTPRIIKKKKASKPLILPAACNQLLYSIR